MTGASSWSSRARRAASSGLPVPTGPPSCTMSGTRLRSSAASSRPSIQPAALRPKVVGRAACSSVRPMIGVSRWRSASCAAASAAACRSWRSGPRARLVTSIAAVSTASWLVAPWCTGASVMALSALTTAPAGLPISAAPAPIASTSKRSSSHTVWISLACSAVIRPACACTRASAASNSSSACSHARPPTCSATAPRERTPAKTSSDLEEDGLTLALHVDVEAIAVLGGLCDQRGAALFGDGGEHGVSRIVLVGEVDAGHAAVEHAAGEDVDVDVLGLAVAERAGLDREDLVAAAVVGRAAADAAEALIPELAVGVRLPGLDQRVGDRVAGAVVDDAGDAD